MVGSLGFLTMEVLKESLVSGLSYEDIGEIQGMHIGRGQPRGSCHKGLAGPCQAGEKLGSRGWRLQSPEAAPAVNSDFHGGYVSCGTTTPTGHSSQRGPSGPPPCQIRRHKCEAASCRLLHQKESTHPMRYEAWVAAAEDRVRPATATRLLPTWALENSLAEPAARATALAAELRQLNASWKTTRNSRQRAWAA